MTREASPGRDIVIERSYEPDQDLCALAIESLLNKRGRLLDKGDLDEPKGSVHDRPKVSIHE
jgi:hypothetical protein